MNLRKCTGILKKVCAAVLAVAVLGMAPAKEAYAVSANGAIARGIDVSKHNGAVNWSQVAASGVQFTFIKAGSTNSGIDPQFAANITGAQAAGLKPGFIFTPMQLHRSRLPMRPICFWSGLLPTP